MYKCKLREIHYASLQKLSGVLQAAREWGASACAGDSRGLPAHPAGQRHPAPGPGERPQHRSDSGVSEKRSTSGRCPPEKILFVAVHPGGARKVRGAEPEATPPHPRRAISFSILPLTPY